MAAILSWLYKDDLAFSTNSLPFLWHKHTKHGEEHYCVRGRRYCPRCTVQRRSCFCSNSLPFLRCKHTERGEEPEDGGNVVLDVQRRSCLWFLQSALSKVKTYRHGEKPYCVRGRRNCPGCTKMILLLVLTICPF